MNIDIEAERLEILAQSRVQRMRDIMLYQINIDNFETALNLIQESDENMKQFASELRAHLAENLAQQAREVIMLKVIEAQIGVGDAG